MRSSGQGKKKQNGPSRSLDRGTDGARGFQSHQEEDIPYDGKLHSFTIRNRMNMATFDFQITQRRVFQKKLVGKTQFRAPGVHDGAS